LTKERFKKIVKMILNDEKILKKDRKDFEKILKDYRNLNDKSLFFIFRDYKGHIIDKKEFENFVFNFLNIKNWDDFYKTPSSQKECVEIYNDSKRENLHTSNRIIIYRKKYQLPIILKDYPKTKKVVLVENFDTFIDLPFELFDEEDFIYLNGFSNKKVREFIKNKEILFFGDFDFFGINIFDSLECLKKEYFIPYNLEGLFKIYGNQKLYLNQKPYAKRIDNKNANYIFDLCEKYCKCLEQNILNKE